MKALAMAPALASALAEAQGFTDGSHQVPAVRNVLLKAGTGSLQLTGTNLATGYTTQVEAQVGEGGGLVVPGEIADILKTCEGNVSLVVENAMLMVQSDGFSGSFKGLPAADFPPLPGPEDVAGEVTLSASQLEAALALTTFAAGKDDGRIISNLLLRFKPEGGKLTAIATDGYRFSIATLAGLKMTLREPTDILIPGRSAVSLRRPLRTMGKEDATLGLTRDQKLLLFGGSISWFANRADGQFPDLAPVLPKEAACTLLVNTADLLQTCKRIQALARITKSKRDASAALSADPSSGTLSMDSAAEEAGFGSSFLRPTFGDGSKPVKVHLNINYLIEAISALQALDAAACQIAFPPNISQPVTITASLAHGPANLLGIAQLHKG